MKQSKQNLLDDSFNFKTPPSDEDDEDENGLPIKYRKDPNVQYVECLICKEAYPIAKTNKQLVDQHFCTDTIYEQLKANVPQEIIYDHMLKLKMQYLDKKKVLYYFFWDTFNLIEFDLKAKDYEQREVLFEYKIPRFSKIVVCPNSNL